MSIKINNELYYNLRDKTRLSRVENTQELVTGSFYTFYNDLLLEIRYNNKIYVYTGYSTQGEPVLELDFLKAELDIDNIEDVFMYDNILVIISEKGYYRCFMDQLSENINNSNMEAVYSHNFYRSSEDLNYRPYSLFNDMICIKDANDKLVIKSIKDDSYTKTIVFNKNIEGFSFLYEEGLALSFYGEPYYIRVYDFEKEKYTQNFKINENINEYEYDIQHQITRIFKFKNTLYYSTRSGRIYKSQIYNKLINSISYRFYQSGSAIDYIKSYGNYITFTNRSNNILIYNTDYDRKEIVKNNYLVKSLAISNFMMVISLYDSIDEDYKKEIVETGVYPPDVKLNPVNKYVMYNPPSVDVLKEKLEYRFDDPNDPLVYINLNVKLSENKLNNFDDSQYRLKLNIVHSDDTTVIEESDVKIYKQQGTVKNMYVKVGRKSQWVDNNKLLSLLENGDLRYRFTVDNIDNYVTFYNTEYPSISNELYRHLTGTEVVLDRSPEKSHYDAISKELDIKDIFNDAEDEKVISLLSNLVNEKVIYPSSNLRIDSEDMYLDYPDYDPRRYIDFSNEYPDGQLDTNVINSDVYFNGLKLFKNDLLQKDNFDGSVNVYLNHLAMKKYMNPKNYEYTIQDRKLSKTDSFIISNKSRSLYQTEKLMIKHTVTNDYENQTSLLPTKGILLPNTRVNQFKIQNIRVYVKVYNTSENGNEYYHRLNPRNFNLWIDKEYNMLRVAVYGIQIPEGSTLMIMDNGLTNNVILYDKLNYIKRDIDSLPIVEVGPQGELLTELSRRTEDVEVIVDGLTLIPGRDFHVMNTPNDPDIPSLVAFRNVIPNTAKVEIALLNENSSDVYYFKRPAVDTTNVFVLPDDKRIFTNNIYQNDPYKDINLLKNSDEDVITKDNVVKEYELLEPLEKNTDYVLTMRAQMPVDIDYLNITSNGTTKNIVSIQSSSYDSTTKTYQVKFKLEDLGDGLNTGIVIRKTQESSRDVKIDWVKLKKESHSTRLWESYSQGPEFKNKAVNFEVFVNNKKIPSNYVTVLNSKAIKISEISGYALNNVMIRFNFSYDEVLQRVIDNYKYKNIDVNEDRYHDDSISDIKSPFDVLTSNKQAKTLGNLLLIQLINSGKNILDCNVENLPIDVNLNTSMIENSYIRKNINLDMNRTNLINTINKISDMVNEILDVNDTNDNLILNSNNPSLYISTGKNILNDSLNSKMSPNNTGFGLATQNKDLSWSIESDPDKEISVYYYLKHKSFTNRTSRDMELNKWYTISMDIITDNDTTIEIGIKSRGIINYYSPNESYLYYDVQKNTRKRIHYIFKWVDDQILNDIPFIVRTFGKNSKNTIVTYDKMKFSEGINIDDPYTIEEEIKHYSEYPFSKKDKYNSEFELRSNIRDIKLKNSEISLGFDLDTSLYEPDSIYTLSFYSRNKNKSYLKFINEKLDINVDIRNDEFKRYVKYVYLSDIDDLTKSMREFVFKSDDSINMDLFGFKLERGLKATRYNPNIKDLQGNDYISNALNVNVDSNSNLIENSTETYELKDVDTRCVNLLNNTDYTINNNSSATPLSMVGKLVPNQTYTLSFDLNLVNGRPKTQKRVGIEIKVTFTDGTTKFYGSWFRFEEEGGVNFKGRIEETFTVYSEKVQSITYVKVFTDLIDSDLVEISRPQLEIGNKATNWSPSYDDITNKYSNYISDKKIGLDLSSKNLTINEEEYPNRNNFSYQSLVPTNEIFKDTNEPIWKIVKENNSTPPISFVNNLGGNSITVKNNESYTFSIYAMVENNDSSSSNLIWYDIDDRTSYSTTFVNKEGMNRYSSTFTNTSGVDKRVIPYFYSAKNTVTYFSSPQIEKGKFMTSYNYNSYRKDKKFTLDLLEELKNTNMEISIPTYNIDTYNVDNDSFYTFSMDVKINNIGDISTKSLYGGYKDNQGNYTSSKNVFYIPLDKNKTSFRAFFIMYIRDINEIDSFVFRSGYSKEQSIKNSMTFSKFKMEKGNIATPYSKPANKEKTLLLDPEI
ncbi:tail protein [Staphylococcus phage vB_StaM_SA1]|nr:tail protein [Staphylococcus phage vB_StaM_SA1]